MPERCAPHLLTLSCCILLCYLHSLLKVRKRLGGVNYKIVEDLLIKAIDLHSKNGETYLHDKWIKELLLKYYDAMYKYQLEKKKERIILKGTKKDLQLFLKENYMD